MSRSRSTAVEARPRTVVHVITTMETGGAQSLLLDMARALDPARYRIVLVTLHGRSVPLRDDAIPLIDLSRRGRVTPWSLFDLVRIFRREKASLVHTHLVHADLLGRWAAKIARVPSIVTTRHYGIDNKQETRLYRMADRAARSATAVVAISQAVGQHLVRHGIVDAPRIAVIPNGIDLARFDPKRIGPDQSSEGTGRIGAVGRLHPQKGFIPLLQIFRGVADRLPAARLEIVGEGPLRPALERAIVRLGLVGRVELVGSLERERMPARYASWDLFVMPSRWEGFGLAAAEAMAMERPVIASALEGLNELVADNETGALLAPGDSSGWVERIVELLTDREKAVRFGQAGRERIARLYSIRAMADALMDLYDSLLE